jgi:hypothetical protein
LLLCTFKDEHSNRQVIHATRSRVLSNHFLILFHDGQGPVGALRLDESSS